MSGCSDPCVRHSDCAEGTICHLGQCVIPPEDGGGDGLVGEAGPLSDDGAGGEGTERQDAASIDSASDAVLPDSATEDGAGDATSSDVQPLDGGASG